MACLRGRRGDSGIIFGEGENENPLEWSSDPVEPVGSWSHSLGCARDSDISYDSDPSAFLSIHIGEVELLVNAFPRTLVGVK